MAVDVILMAASVAMFFLSPVFVWATRPDGVMGFAEWILSAALMAWSVVFFAIAMDGHEGVRNKYKK